MVILGLDPGYASCGWALLDMSGVRPMALASGVIRTKGTTGQAVRKCDDNVRRLQHIAGEMLALHQKYDFILIAAEAQSWTRHPNSDRATAMAWGVIAAIAEMFACPVIQIRPQDVKKKLIGDQSASKAVLQEHLEKNVLGAEECLSGIIASQQNHASDAMACALASESHDLVRTLKRIRRQAE